MAPLSSTSLEYSVAIGFLLYFPVVAVSVLQLEVIEDQFDWRTEGTLLEGLAFLIGRCMRVGGHEKRWLSQQVFNVVE